MRSINFILCIAMLIGTSAIECYSQTQSTSVKTLDVGWYTIAKNSGNRASAKFSIREARSGYHSATHFYAQHHFGMNVSNQINVLANSYYGYGGAIRYLRIVEGSTYAGAFLQVYVDVNSTTGCYAEITENIQQNGWEVVDWAPATMTLPNGETGVVTTLVDLDINNGLIISHDLYIGNKLEVKESIKTKEVKVTVDAGADYVFEEDYIPISLDELQTFIRQNKHLPEVPSAAEMRKNGIEISKMNILLLKKIEELTLYVIGLKKENNELKSYKSAIDELAEKIRKLESR